MKNESVNRIKGLMENEKLKKQKKSLTGDYPLRLFHILV